MSQTPVFAPVEGRALLAEHLNDRLIAEPTMLDAARTAVALAAAEGEIQ